MLSIITCLRHPSTVKDFSRVNELLQKTVNSLNNQTNKKFELFIVCHNGSHLKLDTYNIKTHMVYVDFPPPESVKVVDEHSEQRRRHNVRTDKGTKYLAGLNAALETNPEFVMFIDADDYLHKDLVEHVQKNRHTYDGFIIDKGLGYKLGSGIVYNIEPFNLSCGTCNIYRASLLAPHLENADFSSQADIINTVDEFIRYQILGSHKNAEQLFKRASASYQFIPFAAAMYVIGNGENASGIEYVTFKAKRINQDTISNFSLSTPKGSTLSSYAELLQYKAKVILKKNKDSILIRKLVQLKNILN